jgi:ABC-2 type transport system permease protein
MNRYLKLVKQFWSTSLAAELEYRLNFLFATLSSAGGLAGSLFGVYLFYQGGQTGFPQWNLNQALIVVGLFTFLEGFSSSFLSPNLNRIVKHVERGTLDFVLLKPVNSQFWLSTHTLSPWGIPNMLLGLAIVLYAGHQLNVSWQNYLLAMIPLGFGMAILYSLWFMLGATSIWFTKIYNVTEVLRGLTAAGRFPMAAYPASYRFFFTFVVPVAFLTTVPAEVVIGRFSWGAIGVSGLVAVGLLLLSSWVWRFALRFYTSASS